MTKRIAKAWLYFASLYLIIIMLGCGTSATEVGISASQAILLAKDKAAHIQEPPRLYRNGPSGSTASSWPDSGGAIVTSYQVGAGYSITETGFGPPPSLPVTLTTSITNEGARQRVTFSAVWQVNNGSISHKWIFSINSVQNVDFIGQDGDELPVFPR